jgi:8-oxo-dGTP pyrophosphatase MutT (NUDIX family)
MDPPREIVPTHSVSVAGVVVRDDGRVLVVQRRDNGRWEAPGGVLELGETFEEGVRREVAEETGVDVAVEHLTGVYKNMVRGVVSLFFRCRPVGGTPRETDEAQQVCFPRGTRGDDGQMVVHPVDQGRMVARGDQPATISP